MSCPARVAGCALPLLSRLVPPSKARPDIRVLTHLAHFVTAVSLIACVGDPAGEVRTSYAQPCVRPAGLLHSTRAAELESSFCTFARGSSPWHVHFV